MMSKDSSHGSDLTDPVPAQEAVNMRPEDFTSEAVFLNMLRLWKPEQMVSFYEMLSRRPDFNPQGSPVPTSPSPEDLEDTSGCDHEVEMNGEDGPIKCVHCERPQELVDSGELQAMRLELERLRAPAQGAPAPATKFDPDAFDDGPPPRQVETFPATLAPESTPSAPGPAIIRVPLPEGAPANNQVGLTPEPASQGAAPRECKGLGDWIDRAQAVFAAPEAVSISQSALWEENNRLLARVRELEKRVGGDAGGLRWTKKKPTLSGEYLREKEEVWEIVEVLTYKGKTMRKCRDIEVHDPYCEEEGYNWAGPVPKPDTKPDGREPLREAVERIIEQSLHQAFEGTVEHKINLSKAIASSILASPIVRALLSPSGDASAEPSLITEALTDQVHRLAAVIQAEFPGEPSRNEGAIDTAIRLLKVYREKEAG